MENNDILNHVTALTSGLDGLLKSVETNLSQSLKSMSPEQAIEFSKTMESSAIKDKIDEFKKQSIELKQQLNID
jgi:hypothetical protein